MKKTSLILAVFVFMVNVVKAQWQQTSLNSIAYYYVGCLIENGDSIWAGTHDGLFFSSDTGKTWTLCIDSGLGNTNIRSIANEGTNIFAGTFGGGIFLSNNNGSSWTQINTGLTDTFVSSLAINGSNIIAGTFGGGVFLSTNNGNNWTAINNGLPSIWQVNSIEINGGNIFVGAYGGVFISSDTGNNWMSVNNGLANTTVHELVISDSNIFAGTGDGLFLSTNNGDNWNSIGLIDTAVFSLAVYNNIIWAGTSEGLFKLTYNGINWTSAPTGFNAGNVEPLLMSGGIIFAAAESFGLWFRPINEMVGIEKTNCDNSKIFIFPNPFSESFKINYFLSENSSVSLKLFDITGKLISIIANEKQTKGEHSINYNGENLKDGIYYYQFVTDEGSEVRKVVKQ